MIPDEMTNSEPWFWRIQIENGRTYILREVPFPVLDYDEFQNRTTSTSYAIKLGYNDRVRVMIEMLDRPSHKSNPESLIRMAENLIGKSSFDIELKNAIRKFCLQYHA